MKKLLFAFPIIILLAASCQSSKPLDNHSPVVKNTNPTPTTTPPTSEPSITVSETPSSVAQGGNLNISWATKNAPSGSAVVLEAIGPADGKPNSGRIAEDLPTSGNYTWTVPGSNCDPDGKCFTVSDTASVWATTPGSYQITAKLYTPKGDLGGPMRQASPMLKYLAKSEVSQFLITVQGVPAAKVNCDKIPNGNSTGAAERANCYSAYYKSTKYITDCYPSDNECILQLAINIKSPGICNHLDSKAEGPATIGGVPVEEYQCVAAATGAQGVINNCNKLLSDQPQNNIVTEGIKANCITQVAITEKDLSICKQAASPFDQQCVEAATKQISK